MPVLPNVTKKHKCHWVEVPGIKGIYTANAGFVGTDKVRIRSKLTEGGYAYANVTVLVSN